MTDPRPLPAPEAPPADRTPRVLVLRLWPAEPTARRDDSRWRCVVQDAHSGQRRGFGSAAELLAFLAAALGEPMPGRGTPTGGTR